MPVEQSRLLTTAAKITELTEPLAVPLSEAVRLTGLSRSELYRRLANGQIQAVKAGVRTLVVMQSLKAHMASLPPATFGANRNDVAA